MHGGRTTLGEILPAVVGRNWLDIDAALHEKFPVLGDTTPMQDAIELRKYYNKHAGDPRSMRIEGSIAFYRQAAALAPCAIVSGSPHDDVVQAPVYSFTHKTQNMIRIEKQYLPEGARVLIIDDFLADGQAARGLMNLCWQQGAVVVGVGIAVEKGFQPGGKVLRESGVHVKSLAIVDRIEDGKIVLRPEDD